jgi:hypothetical protein
MSWFGLATKAWVNSVVATVSFQNQWWWDRAVFARSTLFDLASRVKALEWIVNRAPGPVVTEFLRFQDDEDWFAMGKVAVMKVLLPEIPVVDDPDQAVVQQKVLVYNTEGDGTLLDTVVGPEVREVTFELPPGQFFVGNLLYADRNGNWTRRDDCEFSGNAPALDTTPPDPPVVPEVVFAEWKEIVVTPDVVAEAIINSDVTSVEADPPATESTESVSPPADPPVE